eukprot:434063-Rhodomonas_salina.1
MAHDVDARVLAPAHSLDGLDGCAGEFFARAVHRRHQHGDTTLLRYLHATHLRVDCQPADDVDRKDARI